MAGPSATFVAGETEQLSLLSRDSSAPCAPVKPTGKNRVQTPPARRGTFGKRAPIALSAAMQQSNTVPSHMSGRKSSGYASKAKSGSGVRQEPLAATL